jgi:hypothetical protein
MPMPCSIDALGESMETRWSVDSDLAGFGLINTVENIHQCGFTSTVFSQQAQYFPEEIFKLMLSLARTP